MIAEIFTIIEDAKLLSSGQKNNVIWLKVVWFPWSCVNLLPNNILGSKYALLK